MPIRADANLKARSLESLLRAYVRSPEVLSQVPRSQDQVGRVLSRFFEHLRKQRVRDVRSVRQEHIVSFVRHLQTTNTRYGRPFANETQLRWMSIIRSFFASLARNHLILGSPAHGVLLPRRQRLPRAVLSERDAGRLMDAPPSWTPIGQRDRAILETIYGTGIRLGECIRLDLSDVNLTEGALLIRNGKGRKDRVVPFSGRAALALEHYLREVRPLLARSALEPALFLSRDGDRISRVRLQVLVADYGEAAKIRQHAHPHALRHACATHLLKGGADVRYVQKLLGHSDIRNTALYTQVLVKDLRQVIERCHPREARQKRWRKSAHSVK